MKYLTAILVLFCSLTLGAQDYLNRSITIGAGINSKYKYPVVSLGYHTNRIMLKNTTRLIIDFSGYRITKHVVTEYNKLSLGIDKLYTSQKNNLIYLPKAGLNLSYDFYDGYKPTLGLGLSPFIGIDLYSAYDRIAIVLKNNLTFYTDGFWYEPSPGIQYTTGKWSFLGMANLVYAQTYNGVNALGLYPGFFVTKSF